MEKIQLFNSIQKKIMMKDLYTENYKKHAERNESSK